MALLAAAVLSVADYGRFMLAVVIIEFVILFIHAGFYHYLINARGEEKQLFSTMFSSILGVGVLGGGGLFGLAPHLERLFAAEGLADLLQILALLQPFAAIMAWASACLIRAERMRRYYEILTLGNLSSLLIGALLLTVWPSIYALIAYRIARAVIHLALFLRAVPLPRHLGFDRRLFHEACRFSRAIYGARIADYLSNFGADLLLAYFFSTAESGLYRIANRLAVAATDILAMPLRTYATKSFAAIARRGASLSEAFADYLAAGLVLIGGAGAMVVTFGAPFVSLVFQPDYLGAIVVMQLLVFRALALWPHYLLEPLMAARQQPDIAMVHSLLWFTLMTVCILVCAPLGLRVLALVQMILAIATSCAALFVAMRWGGISMTLAGRRAGVALIIAVGYAVTLVCLWIWVSQLPFNAEIHLMMGVFGGVTLAWVALALAVKGRVFSPRVFASR